MLSWIWPGWIFPPQSEGIRRGRRESRPVEKRGAHSCERARSHIARPFPRDYLAMYTMIDAIGARTGARAARAPNSHRVRRQLCLGSARQLQGSRTYPSSKPFAVATTCVAQPPRDCIPRAARSLHQPASLAAAAAAADAKELMSVAGGVLGGGEARRMRFDVAMKNLASEVHGAVRSRDGPGLSPARPRPRLASIASVLFRASCEPSNRRTNPRPTRRAPPINPPARYIAVRRVSPHRAAQAPRAPRRRRGPPRRRAQGGQCRRGGQDLARARLLRGLRPERGRIVRPRAHR